MRARAVVEQAGDHLDAALAEHRQPVVGPGEVELVRPVRGDGLPQDGEAKRGDSEIGDPIEIVASAAMAGLRRLIAPAVAQPDDGALGASPKLDRRRFAG
jgi:hypothetical protein